MKKLLLIATIASIFALSYADMMSDSLAAHNNERGAYGLAALTWSSSLAHTAQAYAQVMANTGTTAHSKGRVNVGENLAWGSGPSVTTTWLADLWLAEKQYFIEGCTFPDCSTTGSWHDVAHYTQLMWQKTTQVGCGLAQASSGMNYYVCHYSPQGNMDGEPVYSASTAGNTQSYAAPVTTPVKTNSASSSAPTSTSPTADTSAQSTGSQDQFITDSLDAHNNERSAHGIAPLTWSDSLAQSAQAYAQVQAATGTTAHSKGRVNVGENLAWGKGSGVNTVWLADLWLAERKYYIPGCTFPDCSNSGSWHDVAHYTQLMWAETTEVGCGLAQASSGMNYYVCHYSPRGNMDGEKVF